VVPLNLLGDFGGGGMLLAFGVVSALLQVARGGPGQVVDAAMTDGSALLMAMAYGFLGQGAWQDRRGVNLLDGGAPFYGVYRCADGGHVAVGALEPQFYAALVDGLGLAGDPVFARQDDRSRWPAMRGRLTDAFAAADRDHWTRHFAGTQACVTPVLSMAEAPQDPHNRARGTFRAGPGGAAEPAPAPRFSRTPAPAPAAAPVTGADTDRLLLAAGLTAERIDALRREGVLG
jgi:alpha-methylacyl-CoA racemase